MLAGCASTYHPEYHPETSYSIVQNFSAPQTTVEAPSATSIAVQSRAAPAPAPVATASAAGQDAKVEAQVRDLLAADASTPRGDRAMCKAGDAASCRYLPGVHINGNVQINGNVTIFGPVYINDALTQR